VNLIRSITFCVSLFATLCIGRAPSANAATPVTAEEILKIWQAREAQVKSATFSWDRKLYVPKRFYSQQLGEKSVGDSNQPPTDITVEGKCQLRLSSGKLKYEYLGSGWSFKRSQIQPNSTLSTYDGKTYKRIALVGLGEDYPDAIVKSGSPTSELDDLALLPIWLTVRGNRAVEQKFPLLLYEATGVIIILNNRICYEYKKESKQGGAISRIYFDAERDYLPVRRIDSVKDIVTLKLDVSYQAHEEIGWIPDSWEYTTKDRLGRIGITVSCKLNFYAHNPTLQDSEFDAQFPPATRVTDTSSGKEVQYVIRPDGEEGRKITRNGQSVTYEQLKNSASDPLPWRQVLIVGSGVGIVATVSLLAFRRYRIRHRNGFRV